MSLLELRQTLVDVVGSTLTEVHVLLTGAAQGRQGEPVRLEARRLHDKLDAAAAQFTSDFPAVGDALRELGQWTGTWWNPSWPITTQDFSRFQVMASGIRDALRAVDAAIRHEPRAPDAINALLDAQARWLEALIDLRDVSDADYEAKRPLEVLPALEREFDRAFLWALAFMDDSAADSITLLRARLIMCDRHARVRPRPDLYTPYGPGDTASARNWSLLAEAHEVAIAALRRHLAGRVGHANVASAPVASVGAAKRSLIRGWLERRWEAVQDNIVWYIVLFVIVPIAIGIARTGCHGPTAPGSTGHMSREPVARDSNEHRPELPTTDTVKGATRANARRRSPKMRVRILSAQPYFVSHASSIEADTTIFRDAVYGLRLVLGVLDDGREPAVLAGGVVRLVGDRGVVARGTLVFRDEQASLSAGQFRSVTLMVPFEWWDGEVFESALRVVKGRVPKLIGAGVRVSVGAVLADGQPDTVVVGAGPEPRDMLQVE